MTVSVYRPMRDRFADQHLTEQLLRALARTGPGGLVIANPQAGEYRLTHARWLEANNRETVVYGYGDLLHDQDWARLLPTERAWSALAEVADRIAHACLEWEPWEPVRPKRRRALHRLRQDMYRHGFALLRRPVYPGTREVCRLDDTYLDTAHPEVAVTVATPYPNADEEDAATFTWFTYQGAFVTGWHTPTSDLHRLPGTIRDRVTTHLYEDA